jgi:hypothetical protein
LGHVSVDIRLSEAQGLYKRHRSACHIPGFHDPLKSGGVLI